VAVCEDHTADSFLKKKKKKTNHAAGGTTRPKSCFIFNCRHQQKNEMFVLPLQHRCSIHHKARGVQQRKPAKESGKELNYVS